MRVWPCVLALGGCGFTASMKPGQDPGDPMIDAPPIDTPPIDMPVVEQICRGAFVPTCGPLPDAPVTLTTNIDTGTSALCGPYTSTPAACVIAGTSITLTVNITVTGPRPLILLSTGSITITGTLDASSRGNRSGPAADTGPCQPTFTNPSRGAQGGGGWGGGFGSPGNNGGNAAQTGIGGVPASLGNITTLTGGCAGGNGADNGLGAGGGNRGRGGGAILMFAAQTITINGTVNASGAGGSGGSFGGGGGGGGSGGMIVLEASTVNVGGKCFANGGGGGEGANPLNGDDGHESGAPDQAAGGGAGRAQNGGDGGKGGFGDTGALPGLSGAPDANTLNNGAGGGGGGGVGVIKVLANTKQHTDDPKRVSPPPS